MTNNIALFVPDEEAKKFLLFQQYYQPISVLIEHDVFMQKNAEIALHFDSNGILQTVQRRDSLYSRKHA